MQKTLKYSENQDPPFHIPSVNQQVNHLVMLYVVVWITVVLPCVSELQQ